MQPILVVDFNVVFLLQKVGRIGMQKKKSNGILLFFFSLGLSLIATVLANVIANHFEKSNE